MHACIVFSEHSHSESSWAPWDLNLGRGLHPKYDHRGSHISAPGTPLGSTLLVPRHSRDRMGLRSSPRQHPRRQFERNVHRSARHVVGRRRLHRAIASSSARETRLPGEARRARPRHGRLRRSSRNRKPEALSRSFVVALSPQPLRRHILEWTLSTINSACLRVKDCVRTGHVGKHDSQHRASFAVRIAAFCALRNR